MSSYGQHHLHHLHLLGDFLGLAGHGILFYLVASMFSDTNERKDIVIVNLSLSDTNKRAVYAK